MAIIDLRNGNKSVKRDKSGGSVIDLETGERIAPRDMEIPDTTRSLTAEARAERLGAIPGVALTDEQQKKISLGEPITPGDRTLTGGSYVQRPQVSEDESALARSYVQGFRNIGGGVLRGYAELVKMMGKEGADKLLADLSASQAMEQRDTDIVTADNPVQRFIGETAGEISAFPWGGAGNSIFTRVPGAIFAGGTAGGLSAAGRGGEGVDVATEAGLGGGLSLLGDLGLTGLRSIQNARRGSRVGGVEGDGGPIAEAARQVEVAQEAQQNVPIRLLPGQQTLDPFMLEKQAYLGQHPEVSRKAFSVLKDQNREAASAVSGLLDVIAPAESVGTAGSRARTASGKIIQNAKDARAAASSPLYNQAWREGADVNLQGVNDIIDDTLTGFPDQGSQVAQKVKWVRGLIKGKKRKAADGTEYIAPPSLRQLHNAKLEIDQKLAAVGADAVGNTTRRILTNIKNELIDAMDAASPTYAQARAEFARMSPQVSDLVDGVFGRIEGLDEAGLRRASAIIFDAAETNPEVMRNAVTALKGIVGGEELARSLLRTELEKRLGRLATEVGDIAASGGRNIENMPAQYLRAIFGNSAQRRVFFEALKELSPEAARNARWLEESLARASYGRPGGSQTAARQLIDRKMSGGWIAVRNFFKKPYESLFGIGEEAAMNERVRALGDAMYNPDWMPDMAKIRKLDPNSPEAMSRFERLLDTIIEQNMRYRVSNQAASASGRQATMKDEPQVFGGKI